AEGHAFATGVQHDAAMEPLPADLAQRIEALEIRRADRARSPDLDPDEAAVAGLEDDVHLPSGVRPEMEELGPRPAPAELLLDLARREALEQRAERGRPLGQACRGQAGEVADDPR